MIKILSHSNLNDKYNFNIKRKRPEELYNKASDYFNKETLSMYATSKSMMRIQEKITNRALKILDLQKKDSLILDAGCGPGFTTIFLKESGYKTVALDIISEFLHFYDIKDLNPIVADMCFPPFKSNIFDAIISISAFQWIFKDLNNRVMRDNLINLIKFYYRILKPHSKVVIQFYPKSKEIMDEIGKIITQNTQFKGKFIIDNPNNPRKRKIYLLMIKGF